MPKQNIEKIKKPDFRQENMNKRVIAFFQHYFPQNIINVSVIEAGLCHGYALLWLYSLWLSTQERKQPCDDYEWFKKTRASLATWQASDDFNQDRIDNIAHWIMQVILMQGYKFPIFPTYQFNFSQHIQDHKNRRAERVYSIAGFFSQKKFTSVLNYLMRDNLLYVVSSRVHTVGIFKLGNEFLYFDSEEQVMDISFASLDAVCRYFFKKHLGIEAISGVSVNVLTMDAKENYDFVCPKILLSLYSEKNINYQQFLPLTFTTSADCIESTVFYLAKDKTTLNKPDADLETPILHAVYARNIEMLVLLLENDADIDQTDANKNSLFYLACLVNNLEMAQILLDWQADIDYQNPKNGFSVLMYAASEGRLDCVEFLIEQAANLDLVLKTNDTAAFLALKRGHLSIAERLLEAGANPFIVNKQKESLYTYCFQNNITALLEIIERKHSESKPYKEYYLHENGVQNLLFFSLGSKRLFSEANKENISAHKRQKFV